MSYIAESSYRHKWISVAAYFKAEARGFKQGEELDDWLEAEIEYTEFQIQSFLLRCEEDGGMSITDLQTLAYSVDVVHPELFNSEVELIREIQKASRKLPCFQSGYAAHCKNPESECQWRAECQKLIAVWHR